MKKLNQAQLIALLRKKQGDGTQAELAKQLGVTAQYLSDVFAGRREPGPAIFEALGLEREIMYYTSDGAA